MSAAGRTPKPGARNCDSGCGCGGGHDGLIQAEHGASKPPPTASHKLAPRWRPTLRLCSIYKRNSSNFLLRHTGQCCPSLTSVMMPERPFLGPWFADPLANPRKLDVRSSYRISLLDSDSKAGARPSLRRDLESVKMVFCTYAHGGQLAAGCVTKGKRPKRPEDQARSTSESRRWAVQSVALAGCRPNYA